MAEINPPKSGRDGEKTTATFNLRLTPVAPLHGAGAPIDFTTGEDIEPPLRTPAGADPSATGAFDAAVFAPVEATSESSVAFEAPNASPTAGIAGSPILDTPHEAPLEASQAETLDTPITWPWDRPAQAAATAGVQFTEAPLPPLPDASLFAAEPLDFVAAEPLSFSNAADPAVTVPSNLREVAESAPAVGAYEAATQAANTGGFDVGSNAAHDAGNINSASDFGRINDAHDADPAGAANSQGASFAANDNVGIHVANSDGINAAANSEIIDAAMSSGVFAGASAVADSNVTDSANLPHFTSGAAVPEITSGPQTEDVAGDFDPSAPRAFDELPGARSATDILRDFAAEAAAAPAPPHLDDVFVEYEEPLPEALQTAAVSGATADIDALFAERLAAAELPAQRLPEFVDQLPSSQEPASAATVLSTPAEYAPTVAETAPAMPQFEAIEEPVRAELPAPDTRGIAALFETAEIADAVRRGDVPIDNAAVEQALEDAAPAEAQRIARAAALREEQFAGTPIAFSAAPDATVQAPDNDVQAAGPEPQFNAPISNESPSQFAAPISAETQPQIATPNLAQRQPRFAEPDSATVQSQATAPDIAEMQSQFAEPISPKNQSQFAAIKTEEAPAQFSDRQPAITVSDIAAGGEQSRAVGGQPPALPIPEAPASKAATNAPAAGNARAQEMSRNPAIAAENSAATISGGPAPEATAQNNPIREIAVDDTANAASGEALAANANGGDQTASSETAAAVELSAESVTEVSTTAQSEATADAVLAPDAATAPAPSLANIADLARAASIARVDPTMHGTQFAGPPGGIKGLLDKLAHVPRPQLAIHIPLPPAVAGLIEKIPARLRPIIAGVIALLIAGVLFFALRPHGAPGKTATAEKPAAAETQKGEAAKGEAKKEKTAEKAEKSAAKGEAAEKGEKPKAAAKAEEAEPKKAAEGAGAKSEAAKEETAKSAEKGEKSAEKPEKTAEKNAKGKAEGGSATAEKAGAPVVEAAAAPLSNKELKIIRAFVPATCAIHGETLSAWNFNGGYLLCVVKHNDGPATYLLQRETDGFNFIGGAEEAPSQEGLVSLGVPDPIAKTLIAHLQKIK